MTLRTYLTQHAWWGKLLGAGLGFLIAGPSGALLGIFIGNFFDRGLSEHFTKPHWFYHAEKRAAVKQTFQRATFTIMGHICKADGRVSEQEIAFVKKTMYELHLNRAERTSAQQFFTQGKASHFKLNEPLNLLKNLATDNPKLLREFIQLQYKMAQIGGLTSKKISILNQLLRGLNLAPMHEQAHAHETFYGHFNQHAHSRNQYHWGNQHTHNASTSYAGRPLQGAYTLLDLPESATKQEVKRAYRKKISQYHPDKYIAQGRSQEDIKKANEKTQDVRKAYEAICAHQGW
ncbi:MAG: co-chaperone DjlA [Legionellaceae bacterium]|nr:co-chaperone DjlA [Legionellaceae bacterium]